MCLLAIYISYLEKCLFRSFIYLKIGLFLLLSFTSSLCALDTSVLSDMTYKYFSHFVGCFFHCFDSVLEAQTFLILRKPSLCIFSFVACGFGVISEKLLVMKVILCFLFLLLHLGPSSILS